MLLLVELKKPWDSTLDEFLDPPRHILEVAATKEHNQREISESEKFRNFSRSGCGLCINVKYMGQGTNTVKNYGYFPACSAVVMLKI